MSQPVTSDQVGEPSRVMAQRLYELLPAIYRLRDAEQAPEGSLPLRSVLAVIARELALVEADITRLYDNWFVETADEWVVPYLGDLLGVRGLHALDGTAFTRRAFVANTLGYRRRKGTATMLEQLARDVTQWNARVVEFFELLGTTQYLNHLRPQNVRTPDLRDTNTLELLDTPFDRISHTADVRSISKGRGKHNIPNIGIFLWRLQAYNLSRTTPVADAGGAGRFRFSPLGNDAPVFNRPRTEPTITSLAQEENTPGPLRRRALYEDLEALRQAITDGVLHPESAYLGQDPVLEVLVRDGGGQWTAIPAEQIVACDLSDWREPPVELTYISPTRLNTSVDPPVPWQETLPVRAAVDPVLGRLAFRTADAPAEVAVSYTYGFSGDMGGGPYDRRFVPDVDAEDRTPSPYQNTVAAPDGLGTLIRVSESGVTDLATAINQLGQQDGVIQIDDSRTYAGNLTITLGTDDLVIQAANGQRPTVAGNIRVEGAGKARLQLNGLLLAGGIEVADDSLRQLDILHCTLVPGGGLDSQGDPTDVTSASVSAATTNRNLQLNVERSICGPLWLPTDAPGLVVRDSIVQSPAHGRPGFTVPPDAAAALDAAGLPPELYLPAIGGSQDGLQPGPQTTLERVTVLGPAYVKELALGSEVIFTEVAIAVRRQEGCVRFSYAPPESRTPRRFRCQPETAIAAAVEQAQRAAPGGILSPGARQAISAAILGRLKPSFTSQHYGEPGYGQLGRACPVEITTGAEDGSEMGAFSFLKQPQRVANLESNLEEYLRLGLEAGIFFVS